MEARVYNHVVIRTAHGVKPWIRGSLVFDFKFKVSQLLIIMDFSRQNIMINLLATSNFNSTTPSQLFLAQLALSAIFFFGNFIAFFLCDQFDVRRARHISCISSKHKIKTVNCMTNGKSFYLRCDHEHGKFFFACKEPGWPEHGW